MRRAEGGAHHDGRACVVVIMSTCAGVLRMLHWQCVMNFIRGVDCVCCCMYVTSCMCVCVTETVI
jgi:hypothetical protein